MVLLFRCLYLPSNSNDSLNGRFYKTVERILLIFTNSITDVYTRITIITVYHNGPLYRGFTVGIYIYYITSRPSKIFSEIIGKPVSD